MMTNLFSTFDPSCYLLKMGWLMLSMVPLLLSTKLWKNSSTLSNFITNFIEKIKKETSYNIPSKLKTSQHFMVLMMITILLFNFMALYPQVFSPTAHLIITLPLSLTFWMTTMMFGWTRKTKHMLSHLVPQGTPVALMNFMVMIELVSNLIRPITLCVRLTANMIAGHLLMSLLGSALISAGTGILLLTLWAPIILTILESAVAIIQAYVFMTLISLYVAELN